MDVDQISFEGRIEAVTPDGCYGVILLDRNYDGTTRAVIGPETKGRMRVMSLNESGILEVGTAVKGIGVKVSGSLRVLEVSDVLA